MKSSPFALLIIGFGISSGGLLSGEPVLKQFHWSGRILSGDSVQIINPYGNVQGVAAPAAEVEVSALIQELGSDQGEIEIHVDQVKTGIAVKVSHSLNVAPESFNGRTDLTLLIPEGVHLKVFTGSGSVDLSNLTGNIEVKSATGRIQVSGSSAVQALSEAGEIELAFTGTELKEPVLLQSNLGDVKAVFPTSANFHFAAETSGPVRLNFPADTAVHQGRKIVSASFGRGGQQFRLVSTSGAVNATVGGVASSQAVKPSVHKGDLQNLPRYEGWKPGDPIEEIPKKTNPKKPPESPPKKPPEPPALQAAQDSAPRRAA